VSDIGRVKRRLHSADLVEDGLEVGDRADGGEGWGKWRVAAAAECGEKEGGADLLERYVLAKPVCGDTAVV
jgi:hypothetical protein